MTSSRQYKRILTIAGSDSGGGAGIQADLKTIGALGGYGLSVITALTAQNTLGVKAIHAAPVDFVVAQLEAVFSDIGADAVKIGMLYSAELIAAVAACLKRYQATNIVFDPVMLAQSGDRLLQDDAVDALKTHLMPLAAVLTPNLPEAAALSGMPVASLEEGRACARQLAVYGSHSILIKGGHLHTTDNCDDLLYLTSEDRFITLAGPRIQTRNHHGTGCTLSSAIATFLARGHAIADAVAAAKTYLTGAIAAAAAYQIGKGHGPVHHFYRYWD